LGIGLALFASAGCSLVGRSIQTVACRTQQQWQDCAERHRNARWAAQAWEAVQHGGNYSPAYERGFKEGFASYVYLGGTGEPPPLPPSEFRKLRNQTPQGYRAIEDWFAGYRHGGAVARTGGYRDWVTGPSSLRSAAVPHPIGQPPVAPPPPAPPPGPGAQQLPPPRPLVSPTPDVSLLPVPPPAAAPAPAPQVLTLAAPIRVAPAPAPAAPAPASQGAPAPVAVVRIPASPPVKVAPDPTPPAPAQVSAAAATPAAPPAVGAAPASYRPPGKVPPQAPPRRRKNYRLDVDWNFWWK
jgi:hypothetical protein